jgi:hypothetical protein
MNQTRTNRVLRIKRDSKFFKGREIRRLGSLITVSKSGDEDEIWTDDTVLITGDSD